MFSGEGLGKIGRVKIAVMAPARVPTLIMILVTVPKPEIVLVTRFHPRAGGGLTGRAWAVGDLDGRPERLLRLAMTSPPK